MPAAAFTTLGCKVNQYETQKILESFESAGFDIVPFDSPADVYVVNSCSVTSIAEAKSRYTIRRASRHNPLAKIVVTGCAAQMALNKGENLPGADLVVPNPIKLNVLDKTLEAFPTLGDGLKSQETPRAPIGRTRATLKIQDGCNVFCSYCSIPFTRPGMTSRPFSEVLGEAQHMAKLGYQEIILTGVLIGAYGASTGSGGPNFEECVRQLALRSGVTRIRISSIEMHQVTEPIIELILEGHVVPHLHIPLQAGDTGALKDMRRRYGMEDYLRLTEKLYSRIPELSLTTDIMVGFPTETEERFLSTLKVCRDARFLKAHVFRFSPRFGTPADSWGDPVPAEEKTSRSLRIAEIVTETAREHRAKFIGRQFPVLLESSRTPEGLLRGLTPNYLEVDLPGPDSWKRTIQLAALHDLKGDKIFGEVVSPAKREIRSSLPLR